MKVIEKRHQADISNAQTIVTQISDIITQIVRTLVVRICVHIRSNMYIYYQHKMKFIIYL